jgi:hypothetical protein
MKKILFSIIIATFVCGLAFAGQPSTEGTGEEMITLDIPIKQLLSSPTDDATSNFNIPIGIRITGCTADRKWFKARVSYQFLGYHEYDGWVKVK